MRCKDTWHRHIPPDKLSAYKQLLSEKIITDPYVVFVRSTNTTIVEYESQLAHEWILEEMKRRCSA